jgi:hypothetical protein
MAASILARCSGVILSNPACTLAGMGGSPEVVLISVTCQRPVLTLSGSVAAKTIETKKQATATKSTFRIFQFSEMILFRRYSCPGVVLITSSAEYSAGQERAREPEQRQFVFPNGKQARVLVSGLAQGKFRIEEYPFGPELFRKRSIVRQLRTMRRECLRCQAV